jgi:hypothetical protein
MDTPLSQSNVSLRLSEIQKRCQELMEQELSELCLEDSDTPLTLAGNAYNPYDRNQ